MIHLSVHCDALEVEVCLSEHGASWRLIHTSGLDTHEAVFNDVDSAYAIGASHLMTMREEWY